MSPTLETPDELADHIADLLGIYEDARCGVAEDRTCHCETPAAESAGFDDGYDYLLDRPHCHLLDAPGEPPHIDGCNCRVWWVPAMAVRIRQAVANERRLEGLQ